MADSGPRYCPRCGTTRMPGMAFCANCGLDLRSFPADETPPGEPRPPTGTLEPTGPPPPMPPPWRPPEPVREPPLWPRLLPAVLLLIVLVLVALLLGTTGLLGALAPRPTESVTPAPTAPTPFPTIPALPGYPGTLPPGTQPPNLTPPPVGLTILSPAEGAVVGSADLTVIGSAPPGVRITQDISFGLDQHATVDGTGHWAINVRLSEGQNELTFRIGDDRSTAVRLHVTYVPPQTQ